MFIGKGRAPTCPSPHPQRCRGDLAELQRGSRGMEERQGDVCSSPARPTFLRRERSVTAALKCKQVNKSCSKLLVFKERKVHPEETFLCGLSLGLPVADKSCSSAVPSPPTSSPKPWFCLFGLKSNASNVVCFDNDSYKCIYSKQTQWEVTTKQAAPTAGARGSWLSVCDCGGTGLQSVPSIPCMLRHWEPCPGHWHSGFGVMDVWLNRVLALSTALWHLQEFLES